MRITGKLFLAAAALLMLALPVSAREVITKYDVAIKIDKDSSMTVTENITAVVENTDISRGIIRVFPVEYKDQNGRIVHVGFEVLDVRIDGNATGLNISRSGRYMEARIGDANKILPRGLHTFTITYRTTRQLGFFENHDELYWNVTGNDWNFPILAASCRVALPGKDFGQGFRTVEWYIGQYGEKGSPEDAALLPDGTVATTRALNALEGLTVVLTWPKGLVTPPPPLKGENVAAMTMTGTAVLLLVSLWVWYVTGKWGKSVPAKAIIPLFYPQDDITPGYAHYIYSGFKNNFKAGQTSFAAELLGLAVKGAIRIREDYDGVITLEKVETPKASISPGEKNIIEQLFPRGSSNSLTLGEYNRGDYKRLANAKGSLLGFLRGTASGLLRKKTYVLMPAAIIYILGLTALCLLGGDDFPVTLLICAAAGVSLAIFGYNRGDVRRTRSGRLSFFLLGLAPAAAMAAAFMYIASADSLPRVQQRWEYLLAVGLLIVFAPTIFTIIAKIFGIKTKRRNRGKATKTLVRLVLAAAMGAALAYTAVAIGANALTALLFMAAAGAISAALPLMTTLTQKGGDLLDDVDGLRMYMVTAEKSRLEMLNPPEETPELFERLLPYALALDAAKTWADRFEKILAETHYKPEWYVGSSPEHFTTGRGFSSFSSDLQSQMTSSMRTPSSSPGSSSGSGGGGFSGGGGGGGGGRGW